MNRTGNSLMKMLLLLQLRLILQPEENPKWYWRVLEPHERLQVDTWAVSNGRRRICRRTRLGFLMVMENAFLVVFGQWKWISGTAFYVLGLEFNQSEMVFARKKVCWHNSCNAFFAIILMRLTMSNDEKVTSTITKDHIRVVHKSYSGRSRTKYLTCTWWHHLHFFFTWLVTI